MDLYLRRGQLGKNDPEVIELSEVLNQLPDHANHLDRSETFRNPTGVSMKLGNLAALDTEYVGKGLERGGRNDELVWDRYKASPDELRRLAEQIRNGAVEGTLPKQPEQEEEAAPEGAFAWRRHRQRERNRKKVAEKKRKAHDTGAYRCEVCDLDPEARYGKLGASALECHHLRPLAEGTRTTRLSDLALVCRNCHSAFHVAYREMGSWLSVDELKKHLAG